jgi:hypothetical protein
MKKENNELWKTLTFRTLSYGKNYDLFIENDNFIREYNGEINKVSISAKHPPLVIGEYTFSVWNFSLAEKFEVDLKPLFNSFEDQDTYAEIINNLNILNFDGINHLIVIHSLVVHPKFRKMGITEEFIEYIYRDFHTPQNKIIALVKPLQLNEIDFDYYFKQKTVKFREGIGVDSPYRILPASKYFGLSEFLKKDDSELNDYKLFAVASKCGFKRIGESYIFKFNPKKTQERMKKKGRVFATK